MCLAITTAVIDWHGIRKEKSIRVFRQIHVKKIVLFVGIRKK